MTNWHLGIDIGKKTHVAALMNEQGTVVKSPVSFAQTAAGWQCLVSYLNNCIDPMDYPSVHAGFEATGHYWISLYLKLKALGCRVSVLNPLEVKAFRNEGIRGNKTDAIDAVKIAKLLRFGEFREAHVPSEALVGLRQLTRLQGDLAVMVGQLKQKCLAVLDRVFPEYDELFSDAFGTSSRALLSEASTPEAIAAIPTEKLTSLLRTASRGRFKEKHASLVKQQAAASVGTTIAVDAFSLSLDILLSQIDEVQKRVDQLDCEITRQVDAMETTITTIPGVGPATAGVIIAEIGDFDRFVGKDGAEKLVALAGLDPKVKESGTHKGQTKMSKRGSPYLRHAVRQAAFIAVMVCKDPMFAAIYKKQRDKGKHIEVSLSHVARKMIHVIYALLKSKKQYVPIT